MRTLRLALALASLTLAACSGGPPLDPQIDETARQRASTDAWFVDVQTQASITSGIITQRTIFAYQFDPGSARLTELGQRDLSILADYYKTTPGSLTITRGDAADDLYAARTSTVRSALKDAGVDVERMSIADGAPGGSGYSGQKIVDDAKNDKGGLWTPVGSSSSSGSSSSNGSSGSSSSSGSSGSTGMKGY